MGLSGIGFHRTMTYTNGVMESSCICLLNKEALDLVKYKKEFQYIQVMHGRMNDTPLYCLVRGNASQGQQEWMYSVRDVANEDDISKICGEMWEDRKKNKNKKEWSERWESMRIQVRDTFGDEVMQNLNSMIIDWTNAKDSMDSESIEDRYPLDDEDRSAQGFVLRKRAFNPNH